MNWIKQNKNIKRMSFYAILLMLMVAFVELASFMVAKIVMTDERNNPNEIFNADRKQRNWAPGTFYRFADEQLGWVHNEGLPRLSPHFSAEDYKKYPCVYAYGDSFVYGDEVSDKETWAVILEEQLGCPVANYGVGAYGTDQAYLRLARELPDRSGDNVNRGLVLFGVYREMPRRNMAASWLFYCLCMNYPHPLYKPYFTLNKQKNALVEHKIPANRTVDALRKHHKHDRYYPLFIVEFPFSFSLIRNLYFRYNKDAFNRLALIEPRSRGFDEPDVALLQTMLMDKIVKVANKRGYDVGFVYFPQPDDALNTSPVYANFLDALPDSLKNDKAVFTIDTHRALHLPSLELGALEAPSRWHFNARGNKIIANHIFSVLESRRREQD